MPRRVPGNSCTRAGAVAGTAVLVLLACASPAFAHGSERGFVLLLPTGYYLAGGALAVAASFVLLGFVPAAWVERAARARVRLGTVPDFSPVPTSLAAFLLLCGLVVTGLYGSRDPLANPLPLAIWTIWWVGLVLLHPVFGNLWAFINPWTGPCHLLDRLSGGRIGASPPLHYPTWLGYWPAILLFLGFAWFELVYPAPDDPARLAYVVTGYWLLAFAGMLLFGRDAWTERAEPFSIFFRLIAGLSPLLVGPRASNGRRILELALPGAALLERPPLPISGTLFILLTLSAVSFDGLSKTFWWLALGDINPLEYPGRTAVMGRNTFGLLLTFAVLVLGYVTAVRLGWILAGMRHALAPALGSFVYAVMPISIAFHFSHYLTALLVQGQYALIAASDPFGAGRDLLGLGDAHVTTSFLSTYEGVRTIWNLQTAAIVIGHVTAVALAHALALRRFGDHRRAVISQAPLALLMVLYTLFGLWLLSTPVAG
jgi:hypothetical protein